MRLFILCVLAAAGAISAHAADPGSLTSLFDNVAAFLNGPARRAPRTAAVAAVRGGIPSDQGEDLDQRLLDRARVLRSALLNPAPSPRDARAAASVYDALAASQYVQALAVAGHPPTEATSLLSAWASRKRSPAPPDAVRALMTGSPAAVNDRSLVAAGWGRYVRTLAPAGERASAAKSGWSAAPEAARLDEDLSSVRAALLDRKLSPRDEAKAHVLAGRILSALATADLRGRADVATAAPAAPLAAADDPAPASAPASPFDPKTIYQKTSKSVALILCGSEDGSGELGTGSVIDAPRRRILTNAHVVIRDATRAPWPIIHVYFKPAHMTGDPKQDMRDPVNGRVIAFDRALDLALLELDRLPPDAKAIPLGDPRAIEVGDRVAAIGHPEQGGLWTLTTGVISTLVADIGGVPGKNAFQTDASINRGNSGGPLLDADARIVGVNTSMARKAADGLAITSVNFAIRSDVARRWLTSQNEALAYGGRAPASAAASAPPVAATPSAPSVPAAAPESTPAPAPAPRASPPPAPLGKTTPAPPVVITESKPYDRDALIAAEIQKMEEMGEEMHEEIQKKLGR